MNAPAKSETFEDIFGTEEENALLMAQARERDERHERECKDGTRKRCNCGAPAIFTDERYGPRCAPCGYGDDWGDENALGQNGRE